VFKRPSMLLVCAALAACETAPTAAPPDAARPPDDAPAPPPYVPPVATLRRLTQSQYANTLHDLFGDSLVVPRALEPDTSRDGSRAVGAAEASLSARGAEQYQDAAYAVAEQVVRDATRRAAVLTCTPTGPSDTACATTFVREVGRRAWRRPLTDEEVTALVAVAMRASTTLTDFHRGLEYALAAMLQAPDFLYRAELGVTDPMRSGERRIAGYDLASRLAYFLWDGPPDDALLDAAANGSLDTTEGMTREVDRLLASPKAHRGVRAFVTDWLRLSELDALSKDATVFPSFSADLGASAREEVLRNAESFTFEHEADFRDFFTTRETWVNRRLAALYGVQFPVRDAPVTEFAHVTLPASVPRRGFLGTAAFLALEAHPVSTSPTLRGKFIREQLLCYTIPAPPVNVNTAIPEPSPSLRTLRQRLERHMSERSCRSCHISLDPIGLSFERFDGVGRYRLTDNGAALDVAGTLDGRAYADELAFYDALHDHPLLPECIVQRVYRHAWAHVEVGDQREEIVRLRTAFAASGYRLRTLLREAAIGTAFRRAAAEPADGGAP
jgi:Protein of unknown function (DUF1592)/Protein of unknown function (DUF1588)/Protein of unknown function (DUF1595)/Protein of unknown function (DUF1587)